MFGARRVEGSYCYNQKATDMNTSEYLRRNLLHASSIGMKANAEAALKRLRAHSRPPKWLLKSLEGIVERGERVCPEMAKHRDEVK